MKKRVKGEILFRQLFDLESFTYTYLLADPKTKEGFLIDTVLEQKERDLKLLDELGIRLLYLLDTHIHADHITSSSEIRKKTGAKVVAGKATKLGCADILLEHGDTLACGSITLKALSTPGHTNGCMTYWVDAMAFTGDCLMIRGNGRTDFQEGSSETQFESIMNVLYRLPPATKVYPAHEYHGRGCSTIGEEMKWNPRIPKRQTKTGFVRIMEALQLAYPKKIDTAVPANRNCGRFES